MNRIVTREEIIEEYIEEYVVILETETHHDHEIEFVNEVYRWKENIYVRELVDKIGLNDLIRLFHYLGYDKNSEPYRKLYRDLGYSLYGYWEVFYWEANNEDVDDYNPYPVLTAKPKHVGDNEVIKNYMVMEITRPFGEEYRQIKEVHQLKDGTLLMKDGNVFKIISDEYFGELCKNTMF